MPSAHEAAFVVILHLSPKHPSPAATILQRTTRMPVSVERLNAVVRDLLPRKA